MNIQIEPIETISLKDACIQQLEAFILAGKLRAGQRLPSERDLAAQLGVSRPVLHQAILALDVKGLVQIEPRRGVFVSDFRKDGSIALLTTLMSHGEGAYQPDLLNSLMAARALIEVETAQLAAQHRSAADLDELGALLVQSRGLENDVAGLVAYDFSIHQRVAIASGNLMYPLIINSLKSVHANLAGTFYRAYAKGAVVRQVKNDHAELVLAIQERESQKAGAIMRKLLEDGEKYLLEIPPRLNV